MTGFPAATSVTTARSVEIGYATSPCRLAAPVMSVGRLPCRARGLDGLLNVRTVRFCVGAVMPWIFSVVVGDQPRRPQRQDGYDLWHALKPSAPDVFVPRAERLAGLLAPVPLDGFR